MRLRKLSMMIGLALLVFGAFTVAFAQEDPHAMHMNVGWVPREILERPVALHEGIGTIHEAVTTSSKEAQAFYDQGLTYLHSFVWIEAARSFNQARRLDPHLAMADVGLSYAYTELNAPAAAHAALDRARATLEHAGADARQASDHDRRHVAAR